VLAVAARQTHASSWSSWSSCELVELVEIGAGVDDLTHIPISRRRSSPSGFHRGLSYPQILTEGLTDTSSYATLSTDRSCDVQCGRTMRRDHV
jgi:hypothetical protein